MAFATFFRLPQFFPQCCLHLRGQQFSGGPQRQGRQGEKPPAHRIKGLKGIGGEKGRPVRRTGCGRGQPGIARDGPFHGEGLPAQGQLVKDVAAVGRVYQEEADALFLLLRQLIRPEAPEVPQGEIPGAGYGGIGTAVAAGPEEQGPAEGVAVFRAEQGAESTAPSS